MSHFQESLKFHFNIVCRLIKITEILVLLGKERDKMERAVEHTSFTENKDGLLLYSIAVASAIFILNHSTTPLPTAFSSLLSPHIYFHQWAEKPRLRRKKLLASR